MSSHWFARIFFRTFILCLSAVSITYIGVTTFTPVSAAPLPRPPTQISSEQRVSDILETQPDITDDFSETTDLWGTHYDGDTATYYKAGQYHVSINEEDLVVWETGDLTASDFLAAVDVSHYDGTLNNQGGLLFRYVDEDNFYFFAVSSDGYFLLEKLVDDEWETLIKWTESDSINTGERSTNRIAVLAEDNHITLLANNEVLAEIDDDSFTEGAITLTAGTFDEYEIDIAFDDFSLWHLPLENEPEQTSSILDDQTLTLQERISVIREATPTFSEDFAAGADTWDAESDEDTVFSDSNGTLQMRVLPTDFASYSHSNLEFDDFLLEVDTTHIDGSTVVEYGAYFRNVDSDNYYYFAISPAGQYNFWKLEDDEWVEIIPWTDSSAINTDAGAQNRVGVFAQGSTIALIVNNVILAEMEEDSFASGAFGVFTRTFDDGDVVVAFDNVDVWDLRQVSSDQSSDEAGPVPIVTVPSEIDFDAIEDRMDAIRDEEPFLSEDFRLNDGSWNMDSGDDSLIQLLRRSLRISVEKPNWLAWSRYVNAELSDFLLEGEVEAVKAAEDSNFGLIFRYTDPDNFYIFRINASGEYSIMKMIDGEWITLVEWTSSDLIDTDSGSVNRLGVLAEGPTIAAAINGRAVAQIEDSDLSSGQAALVVGTYEGAGAEASFDNIKIWQLDQ